MTLAFSRPAVRPFATLLAALVAVAIAADTHAGKPIPRVLGQGADCQEVQGTTTYEVFFDLQANKGKWVRVDVDYKLGGGDWTPKLTASRELTQTLNAELVRTNESWKNSSWRLTFVDRKGVQVAGSTVPPISPTKACTVA